MQITEKKNTLEWVDWIIDWLRYHYNNFRILSLILVESYTKKTMVGKKLETINKMKHEATAYINRLWQFYYFVKGIKSDEKTIKQIPIIMKFLPLRHKYSAHRAVDIPEWENPEYMAQLNRSFSTQFTLIDLELIFQLIWDDTKDDIHFNLLREHENIIREAVDFIANMEEYI